MIEQQKIPLTNLTFNISDNTFMQLVADEIKSKVSQEISQELRKPENLDVWLEALKTYKLKLEQRIAHLKSDYESVHQSCYQNSTGKETWFEYKAANLQRRASVSKFKRGIEIRIIEVKNLQKVRDAEARANPPIKVAKSQPVNEIVNALKAANKWKKCAKALHQVCLMALQAEIANGEDGNDYLVNALQDALKQYSEVNRVKIG